MCVGIPICSMTKNISLADDAYDALHQAKRPGESFSDVARRLARESRRRSLVDLIGAWEEDDAADAIFDDIARRRESDFGRRVNVE